MVRLTQPLTRPIIVPLTVPLDALALTKGVGAAASGTIQLSATSIEEGSGSGNVVGTLSVSGGSGTYTFSITADPDSKFAINGDDLETAAALDYETATSHSVTIEADNGIDTPLSRQFTITVIDISAPSIGTVTGATAASDTTPGFSFDLPVGAAEGDVLKAEISDDGAGSWSEYFSHTLTAQDIIDDAITINGITPLSEGDYDFRFRLERGEELGSWSSTVDVTVNLAPTISSLSPTDGATGVAITDSLVATFNKSVQFGTGTINLYNSSDTLIESFDVATEVGTGNGQVSISGAALTINPTASLANNTGYYVQIDSTAIENLNDIAFAGIADKTTWNFTSVSAGYTQKKVDNNGTARFTAGTNFLPTDSRYLTFNIWLTRQVDGTARVLFGVNGRSEIGLNGSNKLTVLIKDTANATLFSGISSTTINVAAGHTHIHVVADVGAGTPVVTVTINGSVDNMGGASVSGGTGLIDHTRTAYGFLASDGGIAIVDAYVADLLIDTTSTYAAKTASDFRSGSNPASPSSYSATGAQIFLGDTMKADQDDAADTSHGWNDGYNPGTLANLTVASATFTDVP